METVEDHIDEVTQQISRLYHHDVSVEEAIELMRGQDISAEFVQAIYNELFDDAENSTANRFHYYTFYTKTRCSSNSYSFWTGRYLLDFESTYSRLHEITIFDFFNHKVANFYAEKSGDILKNIFFLKDNFGLLKEQRKSYSFISLICLDLCQLSLKKLNTVEYPSPFISILVNKADPTTFLLINYIGDSEFVQICKVFEKAMITGDVVNIGFYPDRFYDKCVYGLNWYYDDEYRKEQDKPKIFIYAVEQKTENRFDLELPAGYTINNRSFECVHNVLVFHLICNNDTNVIGCLNVQTRKWHILDFTSKLSISRITGFDQGNLIVQTKTESLRKHRFYKVLFGNPESLESIAWFSLIKAMKKRNTVKNHYEAARKYLPPNSSINCPFYRPEEKSNKLVVLPKNKKYRCLIL